MTNEEDKAATHLAKLFGFPDRRFFPYVFYHWAQNTAAIDADFDNWISNLELNKTQAELLYRMLKGLEITIHFNEKDDETSSCELVFFDEGAHIATVDLIEMLKRTFQFETNNLAEAISAARAMKDMIDDILAVLEASGKKGERL